MLEAETDNHLGYKKTHQHPKHLFSISFVYCIYIFFLNTFYMLFLLYNSYFTYFCRDKNIITLNFIIMGTRSKGSFWKIGCAIYIAFSVIMGVVAFLDNKYEFNAEDTIIKIISPNIDSIIFPLGPGFLGGLGTFLLYYCPPILLLFLCTKLLMKTSWIPNWPIKWGGLLLGFAISYVVFINILDCYIIKYDIGRLWVPLAIVYLVICIVAYKKYSSYIKSQKRCPKCHQLDAIRYNEKPKASCINYCKFYFRYAFNEISCEEQELCQKRNYVHSEKCHYCDYAEEYEVEHKDTFICPNCGTNEYLDRETVYPRKEKRGGRIYFDFIHTIFCTRCNWKVKWDMSYDISTQSSDNKPIAIPHKSQKNNDTNENKKEVPLRRYVECNHKTISGGCDLNNGWSCHVQENRESCPYGKSHDVRYI